MNKSTPVAIATAALGLVILTGCGSSSSSDAAATPKVVTQTKTVTVTKTPRSCLNALKAAEALIHGPVIAANNDTIKLVDMIQRALLAGYNQDLAAVRGITSDIKTISGRYKTRVGQVTQIVGTYNDAATSCRASR